MQQCSKCKKLKPLSDFNYKVKSSGTRQKTCRICTRAEIRNHYYKNRQYYLNKTRKRNSKLRKAYRLYIWEYLLLNPCIDCGEKDPVVLEFDHKDSKDKRINISHAMQYNYSLSQLEEEISKCEVRCANCHRRKTARQLGWYQNIHAPVA